jgi:hypothetical protein
MLGWAILLTVVVVLFLLVWLCANLGAVIVLSEFVDAVAGTITDIDFNFGD